MQNFAVLHWVAKGTAKVVCGGLAGVSVTEPVLVNESKVVLDKSSVCGRISTKTTSRINGAVTVSQRTKASGTL